MPTVRQRKGQDATVASCGRRGGSCRMRGVQHYIDPSLLCAARNRVPVAAKLATVLAFGLDVKEKNGKQNYCRDISQEQEGVVGGKGGWFCRDYWRTGC